MRFLVTILLGAGPAQSSLAVHSGLLFQRLVGNWQLFSIAFPMCLCVYLGEMEKEKIWVNISRLLKAYTLSL